MEPTLALVEKNAYPPGLRPEIVKFQKAGSSYALKNRSFSTL